MTPRNKTEALAALWLSIRVLTDLYDEIEPRDGLLERLKANMGCLSAGAAAGGTRGGDVADPTYAAYQEPDPARVTYAWLLDELGRLADGPVTKVHELLSLWCPDRRTLRVQCANPGCRAVPRPNGARCEACHKYRQRNDTERPIVGDRLRPADQGERE